MPGTAQLGIDLWPLVGAQRQRVQFVQLVSELLQALRAAGGARFRLVQCAAGRLPAGVGVGDGVQQRSGAGVAVQQRPLRGRSQQGLIGVLAVDVHQQLPELAQQAGRHRAAIDVRPRAAVGAHGAAQDAVAAVGQVVGIQPGQRCGHRRDVEHGRHLGLLGADPDRLGARAFAQGQQQRVHHQRFAGAGLAGQRGEAGFELELGRLDDGEIFDAQSDQHPQPPQCSLVRSSSK